MTDSGKPETDFSVTEELTAYLDGELDQEMMQRVEVRLGEDPEYLAQMQALQQTWDLLDAMPSAEPGTSFTKTTMELVVGEAVRSAQKKRTRSWIWPMRIALLVAIPGLLFASAFGFMRWVQAEPDRILIEHLSAIENLPRYEAITYDMDFLVMLNERLLFSGPKVMIDETGELVGVDLEEESNKIPGSAEERKKYVESLDVQQVVNLNRKLEDFRKLSPELMTKLKAFDAALLAGENSGELFKTLRAYYDWLKEVDSGEKSRLRDMSGKDRVDEIVSIRNREALEEFGNDILAKLPAPEDAEPILGWCESVFRLNEKQIRNRFATALMEHTKSRGHRVQSSQFVNRIAQQGNLHSLVDFLIRFDRSFVEDLILDNREMSILYNMLSTKARLQLDEQSLSGQRDLILTWVESANQSKRGISMEMLKRFENRLPTKERDRLAKMSTEDYVTALRRMFVESQKSAPTQNRLFKDFEEFFDLNSD